MNEIKLVGLEYFFSHKEKFDSLEHKKKEGTIQNVWINLQEMDQEIKDIKRYNLKKNMKRFSTLKLLEITATSYCVVDTCGTWRSFCVWMFSRFFFFTIITHLKKKQRRK